MKSVDLVSNDFDVVIYSLAYYRRFHELGIQELKLMFGIKDRRSNIPIHKLGQQLGVEKCLALLKVHDMTG